MLRESTFWTGSKNIGEEAESKMGIRVHGKIPSLDLFFWIVTKDSDDNKVPITRAILQDARTNAIMNDSFENTKILNT